MEQRNIVLRGIATVLNGFGSGLVAVYDLAASTLGKALPGEKDKLKGKIREYEKKIEQLYSEVGREVSKEGDLTRLTAAGEAALGLIAEHRLEIEKIQEGLQALEEAERKEKEKALQEKEAAERLKRAKAEEAAGVAAETGSVAAEKISIVVEPAPEEKIEAEAEEIMAEPSQAETEIPAKASSDLELEAEQETLTEEAELPTEAISLDTLVPEVHFTEEAPSSSETETKALIQPAEAPRVKPPKYTRELLGNKLKGDLLALCTEKGIAADRSMTKAEIIELLLKVK